MDEKTNFYSLKMDYHNEGKADLTVMLEGHNVSLGAFLLNNRILTFDGEVNMASAKELQRALLVLDEIKDKDGEKHKDIELYINSPGGSIYSLLGIYDAMQYIQSDISTICTGIAMSAGAVMLMAGAKGKRYALPHSRIMFHEMHAGMPPERHSDGKIRMKEHEELSNLAYDLIMNHTPIDEYGNIHCWGGPTDAYEVEDVVPRVMNRDEAKEWLKKWTERDRFLNPQQALDMGFIDQIIKTKSMPNYVLEEKK